MIQVLPPGPPPGMAVGLGSTVEHNASSKSLLSTQSPMALKKQSGTEAAALLLRALTTAGSGDEASGTGSSIDGVSRPAQQLMSVEGWLALMRALRLIDAPVASASADRVGEAAETSLDVGFGEADAVFCFVVSRMRMSIDSLSRWTEATHLNIADFLEAGGYA